MTKRHFPLALVVCTVVTYSLYVLQLRTNNSSPASVHDRPLCSADFIRKYGVEYDYFPTGGKWSNSKYQPDACRIPYDNLPPQKLLDCLKRRRIRKLAIVGDSNGNKYFNVTVKFVQKSMKCITLKAERHRTLPDVEYFTNGTRLHAADIVVHNRDCSRCKSRTERCTDGNVTVTIEYVAMEFFLDTEVTTVRNNWQRNCPPGKRTPACHQSTTYQEFIFREYFEDNYPDVVLLFSSSHDKARHEFNVVRAHMEYMKTVINTYTPKETSVFWFSKMGENEDKKPEEWKNVKFEGKFSTNQQIQRMNRVLFDVLRPEFTRKDAIIYPFFDMYDMWTAVSDWSSDGVHMSGMWYYTVVSNWFQMFCEMQ